MKFDETYSPFSELLKEYLDCRDALPHFGGGFNRDQLKKRLWELEQEMDRVMMTKEEQSNG